MLHSISGKGGILAIGPEYTIDINRDGKNYDKMADILVLAVDESNPGDVWVDTEGDCLRLYVSRDLFNVYHRHKASDRYMMIQTFFVPAIMSVLMDMKEVDEDNDEGMASYRWYGVFTKLLEQNGIDVKDIQLAQATARRTSDGSHSRSSSIRCYMRWMSWNEQNETGMMTNETAIFDR